MKQEVSGAIHRTSAIAAGIAAVLSPIPMADEIALLPVFAWMSRRIGKAHGLGIAQIPWRAVSGTAVNGLLARAGINLAVSFIPGVAAVANATSAVILTEFLGRFVDGACLNPASARAVSVPQILEMLRNRKTAGSTSGNGAGVPTGSAASMAN